MDSTKKRVERAFGSIPLVGRFLYDFLLRFPIDEAPVLERESDNGEDERRNERKKNKTNIILICWWTREGGDRMAGGETFQVTPGHK